MRITHQMLSRNYIGRMNTNLKNLTGSNDKMSSGRGFTKAYENVPDAGRALSVRKLMADNERNLNSIRDAKGRAAAAEDGIRTVVGLMEVAKDRAVQGMNGTYNDADREKIAIELERAQEEILQIMNNQFGGNYLYNSAGNADGSAPFQVVNGELTFNGTAVDSMARDPATGKPSTVSGNNVYTEVPWNSDNYIDIGFGFDLEADGKVNKYTAHQSTFSGLESFGFGKENGVPVNAWSLLGSMATHLRAGNVEMLGKDLDAIPTSTNFMLNAVTEIGARGVTLDNTASRLESEYINLADWQGKLEGVDLSEEAINNKSFEMNWMVTLQLGSKILPQTIFDFIR